MITNVIRDVCFVQPAICVGVDAILPEHKLYVEHRWIRGTNGSWLFPEGVSRSAPQEPVSAAMESSNMTDMVLRLLLTAMEQMGKDTDPETLAKFLNTTDHIGGDLPDLQPQAQQFCRFGDCDDKP